MCGGVVGRGSQTVGNPCACPVIAHPLRLRRLIVCGQDWFLQDKCFANGYSWVKLAFYLWTAPNSCNLWTPDLCTAVVQLLQTHKCSCIREICNIKSQKVWACTERSACCHCSQGIPSCPPCSCCVDEVSAQHADADCIIHFGPSCLTRWAVVV